MRFNSLKAVMLLTVSLWALSGCTEAQMEKARNDAKGTQMADRELGYTRDDLRKLMAPRPMSARSGEGSSVPDLAPVISEDKKNILPQPLVSITVNQDVPLRDIFYELAKQAEVDLELDPTVSGSIIFTAYNRPFDQVVERIADMAGLRYKFKNNVLRVERDTPYSKTYKIDYLSIIRDYNSSITSNTAAATSLSGGGSSGGGTNGSSSQVTSKNTSDFWTELDANITQLIYNSNQQVALTDQSSPITLPNAIPAVSADQLATVGQPNAAANTAAPVAPGATAGATPAAATAAAPAAAGGAANAGTVSITSANGTTISVAQPTPGLLNPTGTQSVAGGTTTGTGGTQLQIKNPYFSINRQAGIVNVFATEKQQRKVAEYLRDIKRAVGTQILIEAKVLEVELTDEFAAGVDWSAITGDERFSLNLGLDRPSFLSNVQLDPATAATFAYRSGDINLLINALSRFGNVHALSSPRLTVLNNQTAVLNVSESRVFFDFDIQRTDATLTSAGRVDITSEVKSVPEGLIMMVHPTADMDTGEIMMNLRPSITRVVNQVADPATAYVARAGTATTADDIDVQNLVPELSVREIDSVVKMNSGEAIVMGGLMQDRNENQEISVPVLGDVPIIGNLFRNKRDNIRKTEMVILLRATLLDSATKPDATDREMYKKMSADRHPLSM